MSIQEKMQSFTDAGLYEQDQFIDFEPEGHIYTYRGQDIGVCSRKRLLPVSSLIAYFFEQFDAQSAARRQWERYGIPIEETLTKWDRNGKMACEVGTFVHEQTENYFRDGSFQTDYDFEYAGATEHVSIEKEKQYFLRFVKDYQIKPYRQEWPVFDKELNIAGTIDMICREKEPREFVIYDWKRSGKVVNAQGQPIVEAFARRTGINGVTLPDTPYYHYCMQQNLYRYMLEKNYGISIKAMNLVVLCPDYPTYYVAPVPKMDDVIQQIITACQMNDLGHYLLGKDALG